MTASALLAACFSFSFALRKRGSNAANGEMIGGNPVRLEFHPTRGCASTPLRRRSNAEKGMAQRGHSIFGHRLAADRVFSIRLFVLLCAREGGGGGERASERASETRRGCGEKGCEVAHGRNGRTGFASIALLCVIRLRKSGPRCKYAHPPRSYRAESSNR